MLFSSVFEYIYIIFYKSYIYIFSNIYIYMYIFMYISLSIDTCSYIYILNKGRIESLIAGVLATAFV